MSLKIKILRYKYLPTNGINSEINLTPYPES